MAHKKGATSIVYANHVISVYNLTGVTAFATTALVTITTFLPPFCLPPLHCLFYDVVLCSTTYLHKFATTEVKITDVMVVRSSEQNMDGLTDEADGNTQADHHTQGKNGPESMRSADNDVKVHTQVRPNTEGEMNGNYTTPTHLVPVSLGSPYEKIGISTTFSAGERLHFDAMVLDEKQLKREKRKQANRESARRSRMRKQAEYEELVKSCDSLSTEQMDLKSELDQLKVDAKRLRLENAALREQLKNAQVMQEGGIASAKTEVGFALPNGAKDILSNLGSVSSNDQLDREIHETSISETITRLHQMLESSSRTDAVAAR